LSSGQEGRVTGGKRKSERKERERENRFSLDIDIWGYLCTCEKVVHVLADGSALILTVRISSGVEKEICRWVAKW
jgi:hypothetical protein